MSGLLSPNDYIWFNRKDGRGVRSLDAYRRARQMTVKVIGDSADRRAKAVLIAFNIEGYAYEMDAQQCRAVIQRLDEAYRMLTGRGEAKITSFGSDKAAEDYLYNTQALGPVAGPIEVTKR